MAPFFHWTAAIYKKVYPQDAAWRSGNPACLHLVETKLS